MKTKTHHGYNHCENCLLIARCRHKYYIQLLNECALVEDYLCEDAFGRKRRKDFWKRAAAISKVMKPLHWEEGKSSDGVDYFKYHKSAGSRRKTTYFNYRTHTLTTGGDP